MDLMDTPPFKVHPEDSHKGELASDTFVHATRSVTELPLRMRPAGCLGRLEEIAVKLSSIQGTDRPVITEPYVVVFAADHGITSSHPDVSAFPREVTLQVVREFGQGRAAVTVLARVAGASVVVVDAGVCGDVGDDELVVNLKIRPGTDSFVNGPAMGKAELVECLARGALVIERLAAAGANLVAFGDIGIGNTSSASLLMHRLTKFSIDQCVGRGTGIADAALRRKHSLLRSIAESVPEADCAADLAYFGGFEIAMLVGAMHECARRGIAFIVDGFIVTVAFAYGSELQPEIKKFAFFGHCSDEFGHSGILEFLGVRPLLHLDMRLGEGIGAVMAIPIIKAAASVLCEMYDPQTQKSIRMPAVNARPLRELKSLMNDV
jgi:nicotinate-nucleotide--dimethylbenzimidazole phosphoribosyltransferase